MIKNLADEINALAERAVNFAREQYAVNLDYSPASLGEVEKILETLRRPLRFGWLMKLSGRGISDEQIWKMAFVWGAYLGTVMQHALGGEWKLDEDGNSMLDINPRLQVFPVSKVYKRITQGAEDSITDYFAITRSLAAGELHNHGEAKP